MSRRLPTLGWDAIDFIETKLLHPDNTGRPYTLYPEQKDFILRWYAVDDSNPEHPSFVYRRGCFMRPRGFGKSPMLAAISAFELCGSSRPTRIDEDGGIWAQQHPFPQVTLAAVTETQCWNTYRPLLAMLRDSPAESEFELLVQDSYILYPATNGVIERVSSSPDSVKGIRSTFTICDQTEVWMPNNHGDRLFATLLANAGKSGSRILESPNAYIPLTDSVAEKSALYYAQLQENNEPGIMLYDHRPAPADTDIYDPESLREGLIYAYGDAADVNGGHVDINAIMQMVMDPAKEVSESRSDFLNQVVSHSSSYVTVQEWDRAYQHVDVDSVKSIALGFDGSIGRAHGLADSTALVAISLDTAHPIVFPLGVWEQPRDVRGWVPPREEIVNCIDRAFQKYDVKAFFADPHGWEETLINIGNRYSKQLKVKASSSSPVLFATWKTRVLAANLEEMHGAITRGELFQNGNETLREHMMNTMRKPTRDGYLLAKPHPDRKIDCVYAMLLAFIARKYLLTHNIELSQRKARKGSYVSLPD